MLRASLEKKNYWLLLGRFIKGLRIGEGVSNDLRSLGNNRLMREPALKNELEAWWGFQDEEDAVIGGKSKRARIENGPGKTGQNWSNQWIGQNIGLAGVEQI